MPSSTLTDTMLICLSSGNNNDDSVATSDQTTGTSGLHSGTGNQTLTGEGSHLASSNTTTQTTTSTSTGFGNTQGTAGPHSSNLANKADPRVDSDLDGSRTVGAGNTTSAGYGSSTSGAFPDDPIADSGVTGRNTTSTGLGNTQNTGISSGTAGPHTSNLANRADPRVDSDLDGSRTVGAGNTTSAGYGSSNTSQRNTGFSGVRIHDQYIGPGI